MSRLLLDKIRHVKKRAFLEAYARGGNITQAARVAGIDRTLYYIWLEKDERFAICAKQAEMDAADALEEEARRRAIVGVDKPVFYKGQLVTTVKEYSDVLLIFLLKGAKPEKYKERIDVNQSQPIVKVYEGVPWDQV